MKLLILLSRFPYPLEKGDKLRAYHQIRQLSKKHTIYLHCLSDEKVREAWKAEVSQYCQELHVHELNRLKIYANTALQFFTDQPYQVGYFYQRSIQKKISKNIREVQPDHIYCQLIRTAEYVKHFHGIKKTIDYMDALGKGMLRRADIASGIKKRLLASEGRRLSAYENRIFDYFDGHTIISEQDRAYIGHPDNDQITLIENGISNDFFEFESTLEKDHDIVFNGNMSYPPNVECAEFLVDKIKPLLRNSAILLSGASPSDRVKKLATTEGVTVTGWVDDIRHSYCRGKVFAAPLFIGTGLQNKLLEAMALKLPCITTPLANNALGAVDNESILIAKSAEEFALKITELIENPERAKQLAENGHQFVKSRYNWEDTTARLEHIFIEKTGK